MFITKKHIPRRKFLRGFGVTLALPLLESMAPAQTPLRQTAARPVKRFVGIWHPHGVAPGYFSPLQEGSNFDFSFVTKPLEPYRNRVVLISGLDTPEANPTPDEPGGDHARGAVLLSGARPRRNTVSPYLGVTIDQLIAQKHGQDTMLSSIQLGVEDTGNFGNCNWGYSCAYSNCISWPDAATPLPTEVNPRVAFERLFGDGATAEERLAGRKQNASILDSITREISSFKTALGAGDRRRLDTYLENVREIERRIDIATNGTVKEPSEEVPFGLPEGKHTHYKLMYDLMALAFQTDSTRVISYCVAPEGSNRPFLDLGISEGHHFLTHHSGDEEKILKVAKIERWYMERFARFLRTLEGMKDADGTSVLQNSMLVYGSAIGDGNKHNHDELPVVLAGGGGGTLTPGRFVKHGGTPASNLFVSLADRFGVQDLNEFGDSTGRLEDV